MYIKKYMHKIIHSSIPCLPLYLLFSSILFPSPQHDWGNNEDGRNNHDIAKQINAAMQRRNFTTWFDSDRMSGAVRKRMTEGIDNTKCMVVLITDRYRP